MKENRKSCGWILLCGVLAVCFYLVGCTMVNGEEYADNLTKEKTKNVCQFLCSEDEGGIENLFSAQAKEKIENYSDKIHDAADFVQGDFVSVDVNIDGGDYEGRSFADVWTIAHLKTTAGEYAVECYDIPINTKKSNKIGLYAIAVSSFSDMEYMQRLAEENDIAVYIDDSPREDWVNLTDELTKTPSNVWESDAEYETWKNSSYDVSFFNDYFVFSYDEAGRIIYCDKKSGEKIGVLGAGELVLVTNRWLYYKTDDRSVDGERAEELSDYEFLQRLPLVQGEKIDIKKKETLIVDKEIEAICISNTMVYYAVGGESQVRRNTSPHIFQYDMMSGEKTEIPIQSVEDSESINIWSMFVSGDEIYMLYDDLLYESSVGQDACFYPVEDLGARGFAGGRTFLGELGDKIYFSAVEENEAISDEALISYDKETGDVVSCFSSKDCEKMIADAKEKNPEGLSANYFSSGDSVYIYLSAFADDEPKERYFFCYNMENGKVSECGEAEDFLRRKKKNIICDVVEGMLLCGGKDCQAFDLKSKESTKIKDNSVEYQYLHILDEKNLSYVFE